MLVSSFILAIAFCAPPGIITAETVRRGSARGFIPALFVQFGSLVGDTTWSIIALTGLAFLVQNNIAKNHLQPDRHYFDAQACMGCVQGCAHGKELEFHIRTCIARGDFASGAFLSLGNPLNIVFWTGLGTTVFASITGSPQPIHFAIFFAGISGWRNSMVFLHGWTGGMGQTMDDTKFLPLGEFDLRNCPGLFCHSTWRANSPKPDLVDCLHGLQLIDNCPVMQK